MVGAGATWLDQPVVRDGHLITSRGPQALVPFIRGMIAHFAGRTVPFAVNATISSPQRNEPPAVLLTAMKWVPRPSLRAAALTLGLVAIGLVAAGAGRPGQQ
jgi:protease I